MQILIALFAVCLFELSSAALAQPLSIGVIGGASLTQDFQYRMVNESPERLAIIAYSTPKRWIAGGMLEVRLPLHLAGEVDGLYHELEFTNATLRSDGIPNSVSPAPVVTWEFPVMLKYRFSVPIVKPFVEAGPSFRSAGNLNGTAPSHHGFTTGAGVEAHPWKLRIAPQVRYTRWARDQWNKVFPISPLTVPDQVQFVVGISF